MNQLAIEFHLFGHFIKKKAKHFRVFLEAWEMIQVNMLNWIAFRGVVESKASLRV